MGNGTFKPEDWDNYAQTYVYDKSTSQIFSSETMNPKYDPKCVVRESRDSDEHPNSTPIIIGLDVTGSMSNILNCVANQLGDLVTEILNREPVTDPQIMFNAIGDSHCDDFPLQVTQFESDIRIANQLTELYFEQGGGGNGFESYPLTWYFAANHTSCDNYEKRGKKGFIFTMGDDSYPKELYSSELTRIFGDKLEGASSLTINEVLTQANREWEIFHLCLKQGSNMNGSYGYSDDNRILTEWKNLLGERAIPVSDYKKIPQIIVSILETMAGKSIDEIVNSWDQSTAIVVKNALSGLTQKDPSKEIVEF